MATHSAESTQDIGTYRIYMLKPHLHSSTHPT